MTSEKPHGIQKRPAPYVENVMAFLEHGRPVKHTIFYRSGDASLALPAKDVFAAGDFVEAGFPWAAIKSETGYALALEKFRQLSSPDYALAGYTSYEFGYGFEQRWHALPRPGRGHVWRFLQVPCWYEADHQSKTGTVYATAACPADAIESLMTIISNCIEKPGQWGNTEVSTIPLEQIADFGELPFCEYSERVQRILSDIYSGRYYELNFTQRFHVQTNRAPLGVYQDLFTRYAPRRGFYCDFGDEIIGSCSPELFLKKQGRQIFSRPIKGSLTPDTPRSEQEKLYAEHIMVVDLARNDIGRVSNSGWVQVPELASLNRFASLGHMESLVAGESSLPLADILPHTYPAASITGAPKVEVVRAIAEYESSCRGLYTGSCGWVWPDGNFDFNVAIRTLQAEKSGMSWNYRLAAGGAIVADSSPRREYEECLQKVQPLLSELLSSE